MGRAVGQSMREERFDRLYREFAVDVLAYCRRRAAEDVADDAFTETFLAAWRRLDELPKEPKGWLLGVARRALANQRRSSRRQAAIISRLISERAPLVAPEPEHSGVLDALAALRPLDQEALLLAAWDGLSSQEAAHVLGCSAVAFRLRLHRARQRLARALTAAEARSEIEIPKEELT